MHLNTPLSQPGHHCKVFFIFLVHLFLTVLNKQTGEYVRSDTWEPVDNKRGIKGKIKKNNNYTLKRKGVNKQSWLG